MSEEIIVNKVAQSALVTIDLEEFYEEGERVLYDIKDNLYEGLILREKEFRQFLKQHDWSIYAGKHVAIYCSTDAIIPRWAYMLLTTHLASFAKTIVYGDLTQLENYLFHNVISKIDPEKYKDAKVVIKGCSKFPVPESAYVEVTRMLTPYVSSIMYGEPCSTVPVYKQAAKKN